MKKSVMRLLRSFRYARDGFVFVFYNEANMRIHLALTLIAAVLAFLLKFSTMEWMVLVVTVAMVLIAEIFNTSIEELTDLVSPNYHAKAKVVKDVAAAGVTLTALMAIIIALLLYLPKLVVCCQ